MNRVLKTLIALSSISTLAFCQGEERGSIYTLTERGEHLNGNRVGIWEYYDHPRTLSLKVDYDKGMLLFVQPDTAHFYVSEEERWIRKRLEVPCRFAGSITTLIEHYDQFAPPPELVKDKKSFSAWLSFQVNPEGVASKPEVHDDPGYGVKKQILQLFELAPNSWIPGVDEAGTFVTSRMAIRFDYCTVCDTKANFAAKVLFTGINPRRGGPFGGTTPAFSFSPDNTKVMFAPLPVGLSNPTDGTLIVDVKTKEIQQLPLGHNGNAWWIDNDHILFMPRYYSRNTNVFSTLELSTNKVTFMSDSITAAHLIAPDRQRLALMIRRWQTLSIVDLKTGSTITLAQFETRASPVSWSPDGKTIVVEQRDQGFTKYSTVNVASGVITPMPVLNARVCGWSTDGNTIYQVKNSQDEYSSTREHESPTSYEGIVYVRTITTTRYEPITELYETNLSANKSRLILKKGKDMRMTRSPSKDIFLMISGDDAYLIGVEPDAKPLKIIEKCGTAGWSNDGEHIAYTSTRDKQLYLYSIATGQSDFLTAKPDSPKKKR